MTVFVNKLQDYPIGGETKLPDYIKNNKAIIGLDKDKYSKYEHEDNLCFFRALAIHQGVPWDNNLQMANAV